MEDNEMDIDVEAEIDTELHRRLAISCFNEVWTLLEKPDRSREEIDTMIHMAHASRYHWGIAGDATNWARGEWQIARVYCVLARPEPAEFHATRCLQVCIDNKLSDFDLAVAFEAKARAGSIAGNLGDRDHNLILGRETAAKISDLEERKQALADLNSVP